MSTETTLVSAQKNQQKYLFNPWRELALVSLVVMELSWVVPWYRALIPAAYASTPFYAFSVLGIILLISLISIRVMGAFQIRIKYRQILMGLILLTSILIGVKYLLYPYERLPLRELFLRPIREISGLRVFIPDEFVISIVVILTWSRGMALANLRVDPKDVLGKFQLGFFMMFLFTLINTLTSGVGVGNFVYLYLFSGLLSMGAARITVLSNLRGGTRNPFDRRWLSGILFSIIGLVGIAYFAVSLVAGEGAVLGNAATIIMGLIIGLILVFLTPFLLIILQLIDWYISRTGFELTEVVNDLIGTLETLLANTEILAEIIYRWFEKTGLLRLFAWIPNMKPMILWGIIVGIMFLVFLLITFQTKRFRRKNDLAEERDWVIGRGDILGLFREAFNKRVDSISKGIDRFRHPGKMLAAARIRRVYIRLIEHVEQLGFSRNEAETPLEFVNTLVRIFPEGIDEINLITQAYIKVRYGEMPETQQEVLDVEKAWESLKKLHPNNEN